MSIEVAGEDAPLKAQAKGSDDKGSEGPKDHKMTDHTGIIAQQKFDIAELLFPGCVANTYKIKSDRGWDSSEMGGDFENESTWKKDKDGNKNKKLFVAQEKSECTNQVVVEESTEP